MSKYLSHGMGVCSTALMLTLIDEDIEFESVFANHGGDHPETYQYLQYLLDQGYDITILTAEETIYDFCFRKKLVPSLRRRWCTALFKTRPLEKYYQQPCTIYIGYTWNERKRARFTKVAERYYEYPLIELGLGRENCKEILKDHGLKLPVKSGCWFCPFQSKGDWMKLSRSHPNLFDKALALEHNAENMSLMWQYGGRTKLENLDARHLTDVTEWFSERPKECEFYEPKEVLE